MTGYFLWLFLCLLVAGAGHVLERRGLRWGRVLLAFGVVGSAALVIVQAYRTVFRGGGSAIDRHSAALAYFMGYEVVGELRGIDGTLCVILPPDTAANQDRLDSLFNTFARVLAPLPTLRLHAVSLEAKDRQVGTGRVPLERFERAVAEVTNALAYVSFAGVPVDLERWSVWSGPSPPPVFVYDPSGGRAWLPALKQGRIRRVVVHRPDLNPAERTTVGPPDEIFRRHFLLLKPADAAAWEPAPSPGRAADRP